MILFVARTYSRVMSLTVCRPTLTTLVSDLIIDGFGCTGAMALAGDILVGVTGPGYYLFPTVSLPAGRPRGQLNFFQTNTMSGFITTGAMGAISTTGTLYQVGNSINAAFDSTTAYLFGKPANGKLRYTGSFNHLFLVTATCWFDIASGGPSRGNLTFRLSLDDALAAGTTSVPTNYVGLFPPVVVSPVFLFSSANPQRTSISISWVTTLYPSATVMLLVAPDTAMTVNVWGYTLVIHSVA